MRWQEAPQSRNPPEFSRALTSGPEALYFFFLRISSPSQEKGLEIARAKPPSKARSRLTLKPQHLLHFKNSAVFLVWFLQGGVERSSFLASAWASLLFYCFFRLQSPRSPWLLPPPNFTSIFSLTRPRKSTPFGCLRLASFGTQRSCVRSPSCRLFLLGPLLFFS